VRRARPTDPSATGTARVLDEADTASAKHLITRKFPLSGRLVVWSSTLRRGTNGTVGVAIELSTNG
jgi:uncharacterized protein